jgi:nucleotide-binding universal stress UspA family protein
MSKWVRNILIPVDFSVNTDVAIEKGLDLAEIGSTIHLLHVHRFDLPLVLPAMHWASPILPADLEQTSQKLEQTKHQIESARPGINVCTWIIPGAPVQKEIEKKAIALGADLVIIGKRKYHPLFPLFNTVIPKKIIARTGIAVLAVKPESINSKTRTIVIPVFQQATYYKKDIVAAICNKLRLKIHLVTFSENAKGQKAANATFLLQVYQWLKAATNCSVEHELLAGNNKTDSIINYASRINADILLLHPEAEIKTGKITKYVEGGVSTARKLQVLAI